jgi:tetraacyldisaccharide 4'-kinase
MNGPLPGLLGPLSTPASWLYGLAIGIRNARFDRGSGVFPLDVPVISVGNLTVGGSGKSPMVAWVTKRLIDAGARPVIGMRGYGARPGEMSDEQLEHGSRQPDVPVVADPDRVGVLRSFLQRYPEFDCIVLDDGFQHRRLARNLDLVLVDATRDTMQDRLLPRGWLREPLASLRRADAVIVTRAQAVDDELATAVRRSHGKPPIAWSRHAWMGLSVYDGTNRGDDVQVGWLDGKRVVTLLGIGNPLSVRRQIEGVGAVIASNIPARDHQRYDPETLEAVKSVCKGVDAVVVTSKDWVKLRRLGAVESLPVPIVVPRLEIDVFDGGAALATMIEHAVSSRSRRGPPAHVQAH